MLKAQQDRSKAPDPDDLLAKAESTVRAFLDQMMAEGWTRPQSLDAVDRVGAKLRRDHPDGPDRAGDDGVGASSRMALTEEPSNDWPAA